MEQNMSLRSIALAAVLGLSAIGVVGSTAQAAPHFRGGGHFHGGGHWRGGGYRVAPFFFGGPVYNPCWRRVWTPWGWRRQYVCRPYYPY